ncbi:MAG: vanadium-dependent haloperoxidase, partial [Fulvivirga sp.]
MKKVLILVLLLSCSIFSIGQSVARMWNEAILEAIRKDFSRPTVHARNLFHLSVVMYDSWAVFDDVATPYLLGATHDEFHCEFEGFSFDEQEIELNKREAISYAAYRLLTHRFLNSPGHEESQHNFDSIFLALGYNKGNLSLDYSSGSAAALGNYIAQCMINYGLQDGSNEQNNYENQFYEPVNPSMILENSGNPRIVDPNRWQPLTFEVFIGQGGIEIPIKTPPFLSPEWGEVKPFAMNDGDVSIKESDETTYKIYHDPGAPPLIGGENDKAYKWGFALVGKWSSHLSPHDGVIIDISPKSQGNIESYPENYNEYENFYQKEGGDPGAGHDLNPSTGMPYTEQIVPRGDYTRVLAEFWADGPDSETPPGHWFTILNKVNDSPDLIKKIGGDGATVNDLEWDIKSYFTLGGALHDAAISAWSIKGYYDYLRPISAIRYMADQGQSSNPDLPSYNVNGIELEEGLVELVEPTDPLAGDNGENVNKIKLKAWRGTKYITDPDTDESGVDWILAEEWVPYQRPTFVTPPFAGFISGHSTFSRTAAEILTALTGDPFFPGGIGEFEIKRNEFLVFEEGPSVDMTLQWATYRDASDQTSLSRIWGGIHPPADDLPGRRIGIQIGEDAFKAALG